MTTIPLSPAGTEVFTRMCRVGRNPAPTVLFDAILDDEVPESDIPWLGAHAWTACEFPTRREPWGMWLALFYRIGYRNAAGQQLDRPESLTLYRGASSQEMNTGVFGASWTTNRDKAVWFAHTYRHGDNVVYRCEMPGEALLADYRDDDRNESEMVVNPSKIDSQAVTVEIVEVPA